METLNDQQRAFLLSQRVGRLATADSAGAPHVVPVCYACLGNMVVIALDTKPKRVSPQRLKRVRNILENPQVALVVDHYEEDWSRLAFLLIRGSAALLPTEHDTHAEAVAALRQRYTQYQTMPIEQQPVIAIQVESVVGWGIEETDA
jgi:PPOX class probable F420-dependent enzyme